MKKPLPKIKKSVKSFILEEDAKLMDKSASKVALSAAFLSSMALINVEVGNAGLFSHSDHSDHSNALTTPTPYSPFKELIHLESQDSEQTIEYQTGDTFTVFDQEEGWSTVTQTETKNIILPAKSVTAIHSNHYDHSNDGGW